MTTPYTVTSGSTGADRRVRRAIANRRQYLKNREQVLAKQRAYAAANKAVIQAKNRRYYRENVEAVKAKQRQRHFQKYGLTAADVERLKIEQGGKCGLCRRPFDPGKKEDSGHVDHDHQTNTVRSILCHFCNSGLGLFFDNPELLEAAANYLRQHQGVKP